VGIIPIRIRNIAETQEIKLLLPASASCVDGKQDGPSNAAADKGNDSEHLHVTQKQIAIERLVLKDMLIGEFLEV
jgi:hypothetical protein